MIELEENNAGIRKLPGTALRNAATGKVIYTPPDDYDTILRLMKNLEEYLNEDNDISPLIKLAVQHYQFESIHPFYDGNGRMSRILSNMILIANGYPPFYIKESERLAYYQYLGDIQAYGGNTDLFYDYMAGLLLRSLQIQLDAIAGKDIDAY